MRKLENVQAVDFPQVPTFYPSAGHRSKSRYVVALVVGYDGPEAGDCGAANAKEAAELALDLVRGGGTVWTVLDRETGKVEQFEEHGDLCAEKP